jgi:hypothetical protein
MLNPDKCVFRVSVGKLLGFLVLHQRIEANLEKIKAIKVMWPPARIKDVPKLTGCLAALRRFIFRLAEWALPFFKLLLKSEPFVWTQEVDEVFQELKQYLTSLPIMVSPEPGEPLLLYIAATAEVVSMVLVTERPKPKKPQALKGAPTARSGSYHSDPVEGPCDQEASGSQLREPTLSPKPQIWSWLSEEPLGPEDQEASGSQIPVTPQNFKFWNVTKIH